MSTSSYDLTEVVIPTHDVNPGHQLPIHPFIVQPKFQGSVPQRANQTASRIQQLDAGVLQALGVQAKLAIGAPNDQYEQEADQVAAQVVQRLHQPQPQRPAVQRQEMPEEDEDLQMKPLAHSIQRQEMPEEDEDLQMKPLAHSIQRQKMPEEDEDLQMKPLLQCHGAGAGVASSQLESSIESARGQGQPLGEPVRASMEQAFGADFSGVRVHTGSQSDELNQSIQARAFTTGQDIFFRQGEYQPSNPGGQELLAHELTHVVQQTGSAVQSKEQQ